MRSSLAMVSTAISLNIGLVSFASIAWAEPNAEIASATSAWGQGLADPEKVSSLYSDDAVLWGTAAPKIRMGRGAVREYFVGVAKAVPGIKVEFGEQHIRIYGNTAINSGYYTFSWVRDGETKSLPARYSFTYVKDADRWLIVDHHSSALPSPPK